MTRVLITMRGTGGVSVWNSFGRELGGEGREGTGRGRRGGHGGYGEKRGQGECRGTHTPHQRPHTGYQRHDLRFHGGGVRCAAEGGRDGGGAPTDCSQCVVSNSEIHRERRMGGRGWWDGGSLGGGDGRYMDGRGGVGGRASECVGKGSRLRGGDGEGDEWGEESDDEGSWKRKMWKVEDNGGNVLRARNLSSLKIATAFTRRMETVALLAVYSGFLEVGKEQSWGFTLDQTAEAEEDCHCVSWLGR